MKELHFVAQADEYVSYQIKPNFRALGPRLGRRMPALKQALAAAEGAGLLRQLEAEGRVAVRVEDDEAVIVCEVDITHENFSKALVGNSSQEVELRMPDKEE